MGWLYHNFFSVSNGWYGFWSGFGSDLGELAIILAIWKKLNCHVDGCKRIGLHHVAGGHYIVCRRHHPDVSNAGVTVEHVHAAHFKHKMRG